MKVLVDTNVLMRLAEGTGERYQEADAAIESLDRDGRTLVIVPQSI